MGENKVYVSLDERDLQTLITAYASEFYSVMDSEGTASACREDLRDTAKRIATFVREYESLKAKAKAKEEPKAE